MLQQMQSHMHYEYKHILCILHFSPPNYIGTTHMHLQLLSSQFQCYDLNLAGIQQF